MTIDVIRRFGPTIPLLGVCLGHQAIGMAYGGSVVRAPAPLHGKTSSIEHDGRACSRDWPMPFQAGRYHSLVVARTRAAARARGLRADAARRHHHGPAASGVPSARRPVSPESVLTDEGRQLLRNFLNLRPSWIGAEVLTDLLHKLTRHEDLTAEEAAGAMDLVMTGQATPAQLAGLLVGLSMKGERPEEIVGLAQTMRAHAVPLPHHAGEVFDTCGTGGDRAGTINVSTAAALVLAGAGVRVAKHGNRSVSSRCGSADVFEALGVGITAPPEVVERSLAQAGVAFLFAPSFHPAMKHAAPTRKELGLRTAFNLLGPLTNPAGADAPDRRRAQARAHRAGRPRAADAGLGARVGRPRRRWPRRDLHDRVHEGLRRSRRHRAHLPRASRRLRPEEDDASGHCRRRRPHEREDSGGDAARPAAARCATSCCSTPAPACSWRAAPSRCAKASPPPQPPSTAGGPWRALEALVRVTNEERPA